MGIITDIQRFSIYDGPGIRTTVFLKGCPLRCLWCHNPECISPKIQLRYRAAQCVGCGACEKVCPTGVHQVTTEGHKVTFDRCIACGVCVAACPADALSLWGREVTAEDVLAVVERDGRYYDKSGGGITISGGEPLLQPAFLMELLRGAKEIGIHTCIETAGHGSREVLLQAVELTDLFLFDWKAPTDEAHKAYTGIGNQRIAENLDALYKSGAEIILRCPIVPGVQDMEAQMDAIADMLERYPRLLRAEGMGYHKMGGGKYGEIGCEYTLSHLPDMSKEEKEAFSAGMAARTSRPFFWG